MVRNQEGDGRYVYIYNAGTDSATSDYNEVRHAGVTMALYQAAGRLQDREALAAADRARIWPNPPGRKSRIMKSRYYAIGDYYH